MEEYEERLLKPFLKYVASLSFDDVAKNGTPKWGDKIKLKMVSNVIIGYGGGKCNKITIEMKSGECIEYNPKNGKVVSSGVA